MDYKKLYIEYKRKYLSIKIGGSVNKKIKINIVDEHHHALKYIWKSIDNNINKNIKLVHFDSHPDMGCLTSNNLDKLKKILPDVYNNSFSKKKLLDIAEIGTWVPILILQGLINEVVWISGYWCHQFDEGSYDLIVGIDKIDGLMKIASKNDYKTNALDYFHSNNSVTSFKNLINKKNWKLHVIKFPKNGNLNISKINKISNIIGKNKWILDIDEDYLSTNNPHGIEFKSMFGKKNFDILNELWDADINKNYYKYSKNLEEIVRQNLFKKKYDFYINNKIVQNTVNILIKNKFSKKQSIEMLNKYYKMCRNIFPSKINTSIFNSEDVYDHDFIIDSGEMTGVPHHISTLPEILNLVNNTMDILYSIIKVPLTITIATSRADQYTPDHQASTLNQIVIQMLKKLYNNSDIFRYDKPKYSTNEYYED